MVRWALVAVLMMSLLAACDYGGQEALPDATEAAAEQDSRPLMLWAEGLEVATGPWPDVAYRAELESPVTALAVLNHQLLAATEDGVVRQLIPVQVADGGRLAPTRQVRLGCRIEAMIGQARSLWVSYRACSDESLNLAEMQLPDLKLIRQRELATDHVGPVSMALGEDHLFLLNSDPFELSRLRQADLTPVGRIDLRQGSRPSFGHGELLIVNELIWVVDHYRDHLVQVRPQTLTIKLTRSFASMEMPGRISSCRLAADQSHFYCLVGGALYLGNPQSMQARKIQAPTAASRFLLLADQQQIILGATDRSLVLSLQDENEVRWVEQVLPDLIIPIP